MYPTVKFTRLRVLCEPGQEINEDSCAASEKFLLALDGATGLYDQHVTEDRSDARWLARRGAEELSARLNNNGASLPELCREAALILRDEFDALAGESARTACPSAGVAMLRLCGGTLEYYGLGDLTTLLRRRDGRVEVIHDGRLGRLDRAALEEMARLARENGGTVQEQRPRVQALLQRNRSLRNREGGYSIFDPTAEGAEKGTCLQWPAEEIRSAAILSDGMADAVPVYGMAPDYGILLTRLEREGPRAVCEALRRLQREDPTFDRYPRFKAADDVTVVLADLEG